MHPARGGLCHFSVFDRSAEIQYPRKPQAYWAGALVVHPPSEPKEPAMAGRPQSQGRTPPRTAGGEFDFREERLRLALEGGQIGLWDRNLTDQEEMYWSDTLHEMLGHDPNEPVTWATFFEHIYEEDRPRVSRRVEKWLAEGGDFKDEFRVIRADGQVRWFASQGRLYCDDAGRPVRAAGVHFDITERIGVEEALARTREDLDHAQQVGRIGNWRLDVRNDVLEWSDENHRIFGIPKGEPLSYETFLSTIHPDDRQHVDQAWKAALAGEPYDIEHRILRDGEVRWVREKAFLEFEQDGALRGGFGITQDITDRKEAEEALRRSRDELEHRVAERTADLLTVIEQLEQEVRQRLAAETTAQQERDRLFSLLNMLPGYVVLKDRQYAIRYASHRFLDRFGDPTGRPCYEVQYGLEDVCDDCPMAEVLGRGATCDWEETYTDGSTHQVWAMPFEESDGTPLLLEFAIDVTERKKLELLISEMSEAERRRVGRDLHDMLGQTMTGLSYLVGGLADRLAQTAPHEQPLVENLMHVISDATAQVRAMAHGLNPVGVEESGFSASVRELVEGFEATCGIPCELRAGEAAPLGPFAAMHLYRIAQEAMNNAAKHSRASRISVDLHQKDGALVLRVADDGVGMAKNRAPGEGMGLRVMRYRAGAIGAKLAISSAEGEGTTVTCALPVEQAQQEKDECHGE